MEKSKVIRVCDVCRRSFRPQFSDEVIEALWFTDDDLEFMEELQNYPVAIRKQHEPKAPVQGTCEMCISLGVRRSLWGGGLVGPQEAIDRIKMKKLAPPRDELQ